MPRTSYLRTSKKEDFTGLPALCDALVDHGPFPSSRTDEIIWKKSMIAWLVINTDISSLEKPETHRIAKILGKEYGEIEDMVKDCEPEDDLRRNPKFYCPPESARERKERISQVKEWVRKLFKTSADQFGQKMEKLWEELKLDEDEAWRPTDAFVKGRWFQNPGWTKSEVKKWFVDKIERVKAQKNLRQLSGSPPPRSPSPAAQPGDQPLGPEDEDDALPNDGQQGEPMEAAEPQEEEQRAQEAPADVQRPDEPEAPIRAVRNEERQEGNVPAVDEENNGPPVDGADHQEEDQDPLGFGIDQDGYLEMNIPAGVGLEHEPEAADAPEANILLEDPEQQVNQVLAVAEENGGPPVDGVDHQEEDQDLEIELDRNDDLEMFAAGVELEHELEAPEAPEVNILVQHLEQQVNQVPIVAEENEVEEELFRLLEDAGQQEQPPRVQTPDDLGRAPSPIGVDASHVRDSQNLLILPQLNQMPHIPVDPENVQEDEDSGPGSSVDTVPPHYEKNEDFEPKDQEEDVEPQDKEDEDSEPEDQEEDLEPRADFVLQDGQDPHQGQWDYFHRDLQEPEHSAPSFGSGVQNFIPQYHDQELQEDDNEDPEPEDQDEDSISQGRQNDIALQDEEDEDLEPEDQEGPQNLQKPETSGPTSRTLWEENICSSDYYENILQWAQRSRLAALRIIQEEEKKKLRDRIEFSRGVTVGMPEEVKQDTERLWHDEMNILLNVHRYQEQYLDVDRKVINFVYRELLDLPNVYCTYFAGLPVLKQKLDELMYRIPELTADQLTKVISDNGGSLASVYFHVMSNPLRVLDEGREEGEDEEEEEEEEEKSEEDQEDEEDQQIIRNAQEDPLTISGVRSPSSNCSAGSSLPVAPRESWDRDPRFPPTLLEACVTQYSWIQFFARTEQLKNPLTISGVRSPSSNCSAGSSSPVAPTESWNRDPNFPPTLLEAYVTQYRFFPFFAPTEQLKNPLTISGVRSPSSNCSAGSSSPVAPTESWDRDPNFPPTLLEACVTQYSLIQFFAPTEQLKNLLNQALFNLTKFLGSNLVQNNGSNFVNFGSGLDNVPGPSSNGARVTTWIDVRNNLTAPRPKFSRWSTLFYVMDKLMRSISDVGITTSARKQDRPFQPWPQITDDLNSKVLAHLSKLCVDIMLNEAVQRLGMDLDSLSLIATDRIIHALWDISLIPVPPPSLAGSSTTGNWIEVLGHSPKHSAFQPPATEETLHQFPLPESHGLHFGTPIMPPNQQHIDGIENANDPQEDMTSHRYMEQNPTGPPRKRRAQTPPETRSSGEKRRKSSSE